MPTSFRFLQPNGMSLASILVFCLIYSSINNADTARILGIFPIPSISHQVVFRALTLELARRGHELVVITPNPALPKVRPPDNITEIDSGYAYELMAKLLQDGVGQKTLKRGVVLDVDAILSEESTRGLLSLVSHLFDLPEVIELINDKTQKFDLLFVEAMGNYNLIMSHFFEAPVILFSSFFGCAEHFDMMGGLAWHPIYYPNFYRSKFRDLTLWEHITGTYLEWKIYWMVQRNEEIENEMLQERFGEGTPRVQDMKNNVQMLFLNSHPIFGNNRPVPPSVVHLGALHLQPVKQLPEDLKAYLDGSKRGVIYVSFGTNVRTSKMDADLLDSLLDAFEALPYDILWKFDGNNLQKIPKNLKIQKWFPQRDLLMHPNIKLFLMQGGLQSTDEAIDAGVPLIGIPMLGDQWYNVNKCVELGVAEQLDALTVTAKDIVDAATKVLGNDSYRVNMKHLRGIMNDQPQTPLERAVWWTEHVLRHGGGQHLRAASANISWPKYFMLDLAVIPITVTVVSLLLIFIVLRKIIRFLKFCLGLNKAKQS